MLNSDHQSVVYWPYDGELVIQSLLIKNIHAKFPSLSTFCRLLGFSQKLKMVFYDLHNTWLEKNLHSNYSNVAYFCKSSLNSV